MKSLDGLIYPFLSKAGKSGKSIVVDSQLHRLIWGSMRAKTSTGPYALPPRYHAKARMEFNGVSIVNGEHA